MQDLVIKIKLDDSDLQKYSRLTCTNGTCYNYTNGSCLLKHITLNNSGKCINFKIKEK